MATPCRDDDDDTEPVNCTPSKKKRKQCGRAATYVCGLLALAASISLRGAGPGDWRSATVNTLVIGEPASENVPVPIKEGDFSAAAETEETFLRLPSPIRGPIRTTQVSNYRNGTALVVAIHITHHGGTTLCRAIGRATDAHSRPAPSLVCNRGSRWPREDPGKPWIGPEETARAAAALAARYHFVSWEFRGFPGRGAPLAATQWEDPRVVSVVVMRDPIARLLAGTGYFRHAFGKRKPEELDRDAWWEYARSAQTDNYALRIFTADRGCCAGRETERRHLEAAKALLRRVTYVLDLACLEAGMRALGEELGIEPQIGKGEGDAAHQHLSNQERIGHADVYEYLVDKNKLDIELYEWSKSLALVDCASL